MGAWTDLDINHVPRGDICLEHKPLAVLRLKQLMLLLKSLPGNEHRTHNTTIQNTNSDTRRLEIILSNHFVISNPTLPPHFFLVFFFLASVNPKNVLAYHSSWTNKIENRMDHFFHFLP